MTRPLCEVCGLPLHDDPSYSDDTKLCLTVGGRPEERRGALRGRTRAADVRREALRRLPVGRLAHGACVWGGLDEIADEIARALGWEVAPYPVLPGERPTARNIRMVDAERPTIVLAFPLPGSRGTWHCARYAVSRGVETWVLQRETWLAYGERAKAEPTPVTDGRYR